MKKRLSVVIIAIVLFIFGISLFGCTENSNKTIENIDKNKIQTIDNDDEKIYTIRNVGTFSGFRVDYVMVTYSDADVSAVISEYFVDDVYIQTRPDPSYDYLVYISEKNYLYLKAAYEEGIITHRDLLAIAKAEATYAIYKS